jgi:hypothetical protein
VPLSSLYYLDVYEYNQAKSAARFCCQVAAWFPDMLCNFYLVENTKLLICQQPPKLEIFGVCLTKFEDYQILVNKFDTNF